MGSKFFDLHLADPRRVQTVLQGGAPELVESWRTREGTERLWPAFDTMARGTFVFLPRMATHDEGAMYGRAVEHALGELGTRRWGVEFYPDESEWAVYSLVFSRCEAEWLTLPESPHGVPLVRYRSPSTCSSTALTLRLQLERGENDPRFISQAELQVAIEALEAGASSGYGLFSIYQE